MQSDKKSGSKRSDEDFLSATILERSLGYKLRLAQILAYRDFEERLTGYGAAPRYLGLLAIVLENPGQSQNKLAKAVGLQKSSLVTILDRLESEGLLERKASPGDRRSKAVWLTQIGEEIVTGLMNRAGEHEVQMTRGIDEKTLDNLLAALDQIIENLRNDSE